MEWNCHFCHETFVFTKPQQKGAHITNCPANPKRQAIIESIAEAKIEPRIEIIKDCPKCGETFSQFRTTREIETGKNVSDFCSRSCANSRSKTPEQIEKISQIMLGKVARGEYILPSGRFVSGNLYVREKVRDNRNCLVCGDVFECLPSSKQKACSKKCANGLISQTLKGSGKIGGYKTKSGTSKFHGEYYEGIWMDSSWEVALAIRLDELDIIWERDNKRFFNYIDIDGNQRKYYPDFYLPDHDLYLECKGYWTPKIKHKMQDVQLRNNFNLIILEDIKSIKSFNIDI